MATSPDRALVVVLGATGYTGRLVCRALLRKNIPFAIAGRSARKLASLGQSLGGGLEQCVLDLRSGDALRRLLDRRLLVCGCAGPFVEVGEPMLAACAELGVHYVDVSHEQLFAVRAFERYAATARVSRACIVPAMELESACADWAASLLAERLGGTLDELDVVFALRAPSAGPVASRGTLRATVASFARDDARQHIGGALRPERDASIVRRFLTLTRTDRELTAVSFAGALAVITPSHLRVSQVRSFRAVSPFAARAMQMTRGLGPLLARASRDALDRVLPFASEGPDIAARACTRFEIVAIARRGEASARAHLTGSDPYAVTAEIQAHAAEAALSGDVVASGVVAPSVGYPALAALANLASVLHVEIVGDQLAPVRVLRSLRPAYVRVA